MKLIQGDKYQNIISNVISVLNKDSEGLWYLEGKFGKGEPCEEKEMIKFLNSRFKKIDV